MFTVLNTIPKQTKVYCTGSSHILSSLPAHERLVHIAGSPALVPSPLLFFHSVLCGCVQVVDDLSMRMVSACTKMHELSAEGITSKLNLRRSSRSLLTCIPYLWDDPR